MCCRQHLGCAFSNHLSFQLSRLPQQIYKFNHKFSIVFSRVTKKLCFVYTFWPYVGVSNFFGETSCLYLHAIRSRSGGPAPPHVKFLAWGDQSPHPRPRFDTTQIELIHGFNAQKNITWGVLQICFALKFFLKATILSRLPWNLVKNCRIDQVPVNFDIT